MDAHISDVFSVVYNSSYVLESLNMMMLFVGIIMSIVMMVMLIDDISSEYDAAISEAPKDDASVAQAQYSYYQVHKNLPVTSCWEDLVQDLNTAQVDTIPTYMYQNTPLPEVVEEIEIDEEIEEMNKLVEGLNLYSLMQFHKKEVGGITIIATEARPKLRSKMEVGRRNSPYLINTRRQLMNRQWVWNAHVHQSEVELW